MQTWLLNCKTINSELVPAQIFTGNVAELANHISNINTGNYSYMIMGVQELKDSATTIDTRLISQLTELSCALDGDDYVTATKMENDHFMIQLFDCNQIKLYFNGTFKLDL